MDCKTNTENQATNEDLRKQVTKIQASLKTFFSHTAPESIVPQEPRHKLTPNTQSTHSRKLVSSKSIKTRPSHKYVQTMLKLRRPNPREEPQDTFETTQTQETTARKNQPIRISRDDKQNATIIQNNNTGNILSKLVKKFERWKVVDEKTPQEKIKDGPDTHLHKFSDKLSSHTLLGCGILSVLK